MKIIENKTKSLESFFLSNIADEFYEIDSRTENYS